MDLLKDLSPELLKALGTTQKEIPPIGMEYLTMTDEEKSKMSLNASDQQFYFQVMKQVADNIKGEQANSIAAQNYLIHIKLETIVAGAKIFTDNEAIIRNINQYDSRLVDVEKKVKLLDTEKVVEDIHYLKKTFSRGRITIYIIIIAMIVFAAVASLHKHGFLQFLGGQRSGIEYKIDSDIKSGHIDPTVRGEKPHEMTDEERTKRQEDILKYDIKPYKMSNR